MDFHDWINQKFVEWRGKTRKTVTDFAAYVGVSQQVMTGWMKPGGTLPSPNNIKKLVKRFGLETYDVLDLQRPGERISRNQLPPAFRDRLDRAEADVNAELARRGLTGEMPEAERITIEIFERYGFKYIATEFDESGS